MVIHALSIFDTISNLGDFFSGEAFFESAGYIWNALLKVANSLLTANITRDEYAEIWQKVKSLYTTFNALSSTLLVLFFVYGYCRESVDLKSNMTFITVIKMMFRLVVVANVMSLALTMMPKLFRCARLLAELISGDKDYGFFFDGAKIYEDISSGNNGVMLCFITSIVFFFFTLACAFFLIQPILLRTMKVYMLAPFCGIALSTIAAGGQVSQTGYAYVRSFLGTVFSAALIAVVLSLSSNFIQTISIKSEEAIVRMLVYCLKMSTISASVKTVDSLMQKAFNL
mgnify:FL=1